MGYSPLFSKLNNNSRFALSIFFIILGMILLSYASVPLYNIFCKVTGTGGAVRQVIRDVETVGNRFIVIRFDANKDSNLPWEFKAEQSLIRVRTGENNLVFYSIKNNSDKDIIGTAIYNVTPYKAAKYFFKIQCFCFEEQLLKSGQKMMMPVSFFVDPKIENDKNLKEVNTITLSYSFYKIREQ
ncbi:cytochrome c oxidase assembly protein [Rickettsia endosymbiont of Cardiosporidium cionae]|uniref:cytochrome c oxidase assembly protein n=1 Tax=Rickettsia endosymbiont of Cardiosporidium cionae TaxID=2777155 RepID=UPI001893267E|nr:cytochrome c oxidase assembly protein [Rickettsia endosymbiont of Cardiosporidium cionae]KAF8818010.1 cytochrome c oxidase assembly protein [Rickettsia endosymbiont of Cardiosporidium cionae]